MKKNRIKDLRGFENLGGLPHFTILWQNPFLHTIRVDEYKTLIPKQINKGG